MIYKEFLTAWLHEQKTFQKYSTYTNYLNIVENHLIPDLGDSEMYEVNGAVNGDIAAIGYHAVSAIAGVSYTNGLGSTSGSTPGTVKSVNHSTAVTQADGSSPTQIQPYQAAYFWRRTA